MVIWLCARFALCWDSFWMRKARREGVDSTSVKVRAVSMSVGSRVSVACCIAGAWRDWELSWRYIEPNVVEALNADVYAVSDTVVRTPGTHGRGDPSFTIERMRAVFGRRFRAGEQLSVEQMANVSGLAWPEIVDAQADLGRLSKAFPYVFKIWRCGQLVARSRVRYDAIVRLRPDLIPQVPFHLSRWGGDGFELRVGPVCTQFGPRAVVVHAFTNYCANDWLALGSATAMTLTMDLARFWTPASRWLSADAVLDETLSSGVEIAHNNLWRRTGTQVLRVPLFVEMARRRCVRPRCVRMPVWAVHAQHDACAATNSTPSAAPTAPAAGAPEPAGGARVARGARRAAGAMAVGSTQKARHGLMNDCGAADGTPRAEPWFAGPLPGDPAPSSEPAGRAGAEPRHAALARRGKARGQSPSGMAAAEPPRQIRLRSVPGWRRPDCGEVADLGRRDPLPPCKMPSREYEVRVLRGYGQPLLYEP